MTKNQTLVKPVAAIGEEIGLELGEQFITSYQKANDDVLAYQIGKNILNQILAQPGCEGIRFYNAYNEMGEKTLVYVGLNKDGKALIEYTVVNNEGELEAAKGIVADRTLPPKPGGGGRTSDSDDWNITID